MIKKIVVKNYYTFILLGLLALILVMFSITKSATFWKPGTWLSMATQFPEYGVFALGVMLCFLIGCIDISFVALGNFATVLACMLMVRLSGDGSGPQGPIVILASLFALVIGALGGLINGNLISRMGIPPILATLATQLVFMGIAIALTRGNAVTGIPEIYGDIGHINLFGFLPVPLLIFIIILLICVFLIRRTTYGKKLYMIGSNPKAARFSAINVTGMINATFVIAGVLAAAGALLMVNTMNSAKADYGSTYLMRCILIAVLAGVSPNGGAGKILNVLISIVIVQIIASGVNMFSQLNAYYVSLISAVLLLVVLVGTSRMLGERKSRKARKKDSVATD